MFNNVRTPFSLDTTSHVLLQHLQILMKPEMFTGPTDVSVCEREKSTFLPSSPPMIRPQPCPPGTDQTGSAEVSSIYSPRSLFSSALCPLTAAPEQTLSRALRSPLLFLFPCSHFLSQQSPFLSHAVPVSSPPLSSSSVSSVLHSCTKPSFYVFFCVSSSWSPLAVLHFESYSSLLKVALMSLFLANGVKNNQ